MKTILKYNLYITDEQTISMHEGARILDVQMQNGTPFLWALNDTCNGWQDRVIKIYGTGNPIERQSGHGIIYIGTIQSDAFVWHVFEEVC